MLGYHDNDRCAFDLWSPVDDQCNSLDTIYTHPHCPPGMPTAIENRAFSSYCKHQQEIMDVANMICNGGTSFELDDDWDQTDLDELNRILRERGVEASFSLT